MSTYLKKGIRPAVFIIVLLLLLQGLSYFLSPEETAIKMRCLS